MKRSVAILSCLVTLAASGAVQADIVAPFGTYENYGIWYDRDTVSPSQATNWGAVDGGTYNTGGIYDVVIDYHAVDATTATMFATINGIQQGFYTNGYKNAQPDIYPAGLSFTNSDMTQMQVFSSIWGSASINGTAVFENITAAGTRLSGAFQTTNYGNATYSGSPIYGGDLASQYTPGIWNLTASDLILSFRADLSGVIGPSDIFAIGLQPNGLDRRTPPGGGWMAMQVVNSAPSPGELALNDKFDLQNGFNDETAYNVVVVPEWSSILLAVSGLGSVLALRRRRA